MATTSTDQATGGNSTAHKDWIEYRRHFTQEGRDPFGTVTWGRRRAVAGDFSQDDVEAPEQWSDQSVGIVAKLYFATVDGVREDSVRQIVSRVVGKIITEMRSLGYFREQGALDVMEDLPGFWTADAIIFHDELVYVLLHQYATFNSPVWFNLGVPGRRQTSSACFLLSVEDHMLGEDSITDWWRKEAAIFKMGAGTGINISKIRGSMEPLSTGGIASGPVAYMRPADAGAGTLKSGGAHRRAAKFVRLDVDHPDIRDFVNCKVREDERMRALSAAGISMDPSTPDGEINIAESTSFQNENISVGVTDAFMETVEAEGPWNLISRTMGEVVETIEASGLLDDVAAAAWKVADPGLQFHDAINRWNTVPNFGPITTSNVCSEIFQPDDSSCNLANINLLKFVGPEGFDSDGLRQVVDVLVPAMDSTCSFADLPTPRIEQNTRDLRQLGIGWSNLGSALMAQGMPYDSDEGRDFASATTALLTGRAYRRSAELAKYMGAFAHFEANREAMLGVIDMHRHHLPESKADGCVWFDAMDEWAVVAKKGAKYGFRNSQVTTMQPGGTTSYMLGADTTGIEPAFSLVSYKSLAAGGQMRLVNGVVRSALAAVGYQDDVLDEMVATLERDDGEFYSSLNGHREGFQTAVGEHSIAPLAHVRMCASIQPYISQGISKTVNLPNDCTPLDIREVYVEAWRAGLKSISVYRDGSKSTQVLTARAPVESVEGALATRGDVSTTPFDATPRRRRMPRERSARVAKFEIGDLEGYLTAGMYDDGDLGEIFLNGIGKDGSTLRGMADAFAVAISIGLQHGVPLEVYARKYAHVRFEPFGRTNDPDVPVTSSIVDYISRKLAAMFLDPDQCEALGVMTPEVRTRIAEHLDDDAEYRSAPSTDIGVACVQCGGNMVRAGSCWSCPNCFASTGCG